MRPKSGRYNPAISISTLVFPLPDGPNNEVTCCSASNATSSSNPLA
jgi:hypothetical protein